MAKYKENFNKNLNLGRCNIYCKSFTEQFQIIMHKIMHIQTHTSKNSINDGQKKVIVLSVWNYISFCCTHQL